MNADETELEFLLKDAKRALAHADPADPEQLKHVVGPVVRMITRLWSRLNSPFDSDAWYPVSALLSEHWPEIVSYQSKVIDGEWLNPWGDLAPEDGEIVHPADLPYVKAFNAALRPGAETSALVTTAWPEPWIGPATQASVLVLGANPGWAGDEDAESQARLAHLARANLSGHEPLIWLNEQAHGTPADRWYRSRLLADVLGSKANIDESIVARSLAFVDFHAYHAVRWHPIPVTLPTQHHTFALVRQRLADDALIVLTRCAFEWCVAIPELTKHPNVYRTRSRQNPRLSPNNLGDEGWNELIARLRA
jgi:hypothetical protein